jgi:hypothetical protein
VFTTRERQNVDLRRCGARQRPRAGVHGGSGGQDIVDQDHAAALDFGPLVGRYLECALHIAGPLRSGQSELLLSRPNAP